MYFIGVDLGGTSMSAGLVDSEGKIHFRSSAPTSPYMPHEDILNKMVSMCNDIVEKTGIGYGDIGYVGVGIPGAVNPDKGIIEFTGNLKFENVDAAAFMNNKIPVPFYIDNDAKCAALGEILCGAAKGKSSAVMITVGTGLGGGIIIDGKIHAGAFFGGGEIGHHVIVSGGKKCNCGRYGCWEKYASATAIIEQARQLAGENKDSKIYELCGGNLECIDAKMVFDAYDENDSCAVSIIEDYYTYFSEGLMNLLNIIQPEIVVIGGGVSARGEKLLEPIREKVRSMMYGTTELKTEIVSADLGNDSGIIGAAMLRR